MAIVSKQLKFESQLVVELLACVHVCLHVVTVHTYLYMSHTWSMRNQSCKNLEKQRILGFVMNRNLWYKHWECMYSWKTLCIVCTYKQLDTIAMSLQFKLCLACGISAGWKSRRSGCP